MNQKLMCSLTATLLITLGTSAVQAKPSGEANPNSKLHQDPALTQATDSGSVNPLANPDAKLGERSSQSSIKSVTSDQSEPQPPKSTTLTAPSQRSTQKGPAKDPIKVGERQSSKTIAADRDVTAKIYAHDYEGRPAATLYVRNIPVLTFLGAAPAKANGVKIGTQVAQTSRLSIADSKSLPTSETATATELSSTSVASASSQDDPVLRASALAAQLNQMSRDNLKADNITVSWVAPSGKGDAAAERYRINVNDTVLAVVDAQTILPNSTRNLETDALEATNLMRRLMGDAAPLSSVAGKPKPAATIALGAIRIQLNGFASWYGPGFDGNASASGEIFNQNDLTAAHRTLPFGTRVRVTNLDNGASVIVRITDRGPYVDDRVIDLSAGAARVVGLINSGVAPVRLDVLDDRQASVSP